MSVTYTGAENDREKALVAAPVNRALTAKVPDGRGQAVLDCPTTTGHSYRRLIGTTL